VIPIRTADRRVVPFEDALKWDRRRNSWKGDEAGRRLQMLPFLAFILRKFWSEVGEKSFED
jgi:hypothetical protein